MLHVSPACLQLEICKGSPPPSRGAWAALLNAIETDPVSGILLLTLASPLAHATCMAPNTLHAHGLAQPRVARNHASNN